MTRLITIEQAVEAVERVHAEAEAGDGCFSRPDLIAALRAIPPAEPTEEEVGRVTKAVFDNCVITKEGCRKIARAAIAALKQPGGKER